MQKIKHAIIIDDHKIDCIIFEKTLLATGLFEKVEYFTASSDALAALFKAVKSNLTLPNIIFLDINMPQINGWEFMAELLKISPEIAKQLKIVMISSSIDTNDRLKAAQHPLVLDYILKPVSIKTLQELHTKLK